MIVDVGLCGFETFDTPCGLCYQRIELGNWLSMVVHPSMAQDFLDQAAKVLDELDADKSQVRLLRNDHLKMLEDLDVWGSKAEPQKSWHELIKCV